MRLRASVARRGRALVAALVLVATGAHADTWRFPATVQSEVEMHGETSIRRIRDARENQSYPLYTIEVSRGEQLLARIPGVSYEKLFAAPDRSFFVGLSNDGLPGTAVVILGQDGQLRMEVKHGPARFDYCQESATRRRVWFDADEPAVKFTKDPKWGGYAVTLRTCRGREVNLLAEIAEAQNRAFLLRQSHAR